MPASNPPPAEFPTNITDFSAVRNQFTLGGGATVSGSSLQLTSTASNQGGIAVYNQAISSLGGSSFTFDYTSTGGGADGLSFFLVDGDKVADPTQIQAGAYGGGLGYASIVAGHQGITNGFLGVGFDTVGSYEALNGGLFQIPNSVGVRGAGSGSTGYALISSNVYAPGIDGDRTVHVNLTKISPTQERVHIMVAPTGTQNFTTVVDTLVNQPVPSKFYVGFAASTGVLADSHVIHNFAATLPVSLSLGAVTVTDQTTGQVNPAYLNPGDRLTETYTVANSGPNDDAQVLVTEALPLNVVSSSWQVTDSAGIHTGSGSGIPLNIAAGSTATITVSGQVDPNASAGNADSVISLSPGGAFTNNSASPSQRAVAVHIGQAGGGSVSLVGSNQVVSTTDGAAVMPFNGSTGAPAALVVDTYQSSNGGGNTETLKVSVNPLLGSLASAGAAYDTAKGILTASGTAAQVQAILQGVVFTPVAHAVQPGTQTAVELNVAILSTTPGNATGPGNTEPSAGQTQTVVVSPVHDTPVISGAANGQNVADNATTGPFASVSVTDPDYVGAVATVTVQGGTVQGDFTLASTRNWTRNIASNGDVLYSRTFAAQPNIGAPVQAALRALVFMPATLSSMQQNPNTVSILLAVTDTAPNPASANAVASLRVQDVTAPAAPTNVSLSAASDTGVQGDGITASAQPSFTGMAEAGSTVTLWDGGMAMGSGTASATGAWSIASAPLMDGQHSISATTMDEAGFASAPSAATAIMVTTASPAAQSVTTSTSGGTGMTPSQTVTFTVTTNEPVSVDTTAGTPFLVLNDGGMALYTGQADGQHLVFTYTPKAGERTDNLTVTGFNANGGSIRDAAGNSVSPSSFPNASGAQSGVSVNAATPIYRFFNTHTGSHFYTASSQEEATIQNTRPDLVEETSTFQGVTQNSASAEAIYRFFDTKDGSHFLTSDANEVKTVMQTRPDLVYEGVNFYAHATRQSGDTAVYRFFDTGNGGHLYTTAESERASLAVNPAFVSEGVGFWAPLNTHV